MTQLYAYAAGAAIIAAIGGTALWTVFANPPECGGNAVAGGSAAIGGPFTLINSDGQAVSETDVIDGPTLVYFGYTYCPDVCPFDLARNALAIDILNEQGQDVTPVFITIDPDRDTPEVVGEYADAMHPDMIGLTGTPEQVKAASQAYKTFYARGSGDDEFYLMEHSTFTYLMMPETGLASYFGRDVSPEDMAEQTSCLIGAV